METTIIKSSFLDYLSLEASTLSGFRKTALLKAIGEISKYPSEYIPLSQLGKIRGVGKGIIERAMTYTNSDIYRRAEVVDCFQEVYGVGPVIANKWYEAGYRKFSDIPDAALTRAQKLGIKHYEDIMHKIPRSEIDLINQKLQAHVLKFNARYSVSVYALICGSYIRGRATSGDIDIIISEKSDGLDINLFLEECKDIVWEILAQGPSKVLTLGGLTRYRRIDFELVKWEELPFAQLYFTGSGNFNKAMRAHAKALGYTLNQKGLYMYGKKVMIAQSEQEIFEFLSLKYVEPYQRDV